MGCGASLVGDRAPSMHNDREVTGEKPPFCVRHSGPPSSPSLPGDGCSLGASEAGIGMPPDAPPQEILRADTITPTTAPPRFSFLTARNGPKLDRHRPGVGGILFTTPAPKQRSQRGRIAPMQWVSALSSSSSTLQEIHPGDAMSFSDISTGTMPHLSNNYARSAANSRSSKAHQTSATLLSAPNLPSRQPRRHLQRGNLSCSIPTNVSTVFLMSSSLPILQIEVHEIVTNDGGNDGFMSATWGTSSHESAAQSSRSIGLLSCTPQCVLEGPPPSSSGLTGKTSLRGLVEEL